MEMTILERDDDITHITLAGRLDTTGAEKIDKSFAEATTAQKRPAIVDLSEIEFLASRGIGLLFFNAKQLKRNGHKLVLLNPKRLVESVLKTSRVDKLMPIVHDLDEAIQILQGEAGAPSPPVTASADESRPQPSEPVAAALPVIEGELKLPIKNELSELEGFNASLAEFLESHRVPYRATYAVNLVIDELVTNVMRYAYVDTDTHLIDIELAIEGGQVILRIVDDGRPFDPRTGPSLDLHAEDREVGGLGLILVLDMVDVLTYERVEEKNCVEVRVHLTAAAENVEPSEAVDDLPEADGE